MALPRSSRLPRRDRCENEGGSGQRDCPDVPDLKARAKDRASELQGEKLKSKGHHEPQREHNDKHKKREREKWEVRAEVRPEGACQVVAGLMPLRSGDD